MGWGWGKPSSSGVRCRVKEADTTEFVAAAREDSLYISGRFWILGILHVLSVDRRCLVSPPLTVGGQGTRGALEYLLGLGERASPWAQAVVW